MTCPKCGVENPESARFCVRCHTPVTFACPSCKHTQSHGGKCEECGVDFEKYASTLEFAMRVDARALRDRRQARSELAKQALLLPLTGGWSLLKYLRSSLGGE